MADFIQITDTMHPLPVGARIKSIAGELDCDENDAFRDTGPDAVGEILDARFYDHQGWTYGIGFPNGTYIFLCQSDDNLTDPAAYLLGKPEVVAPAQSPVFADEAELKAFIRDELMSQLHDDLQRMTLWEAAMYTDEDRETKRRQIDATRAFFDSNGFGRR